MHMCVHVCVYRCMCICMYIYAYMYVCIYVCIHNHIRTRVGVHMHSCRRILFICTVQSLYYRDARVSQVFLNTCMRVCGGLEVGFVSACSSLALVTGVGGYVLAGVEIGVFDKTISLI